MRLVRHLISLGPLEPPPTFGSQLRRYRIIDMAGRVWGLIRFDKSTLCCRPWSRWPSSCIGRMMMVIMLLSTCDPIWAMRKDVSLAFSRGRQYERTKYSDLDPARAVRAVWLNWLQTRRDCAPALQRPLIGFEVPVPCAMLPVAQVCPAVASWGIFPPLPSIMHNLHNFSPALAAKRSGYLPRYSGPSETLTSGDLEALVRC